MATKVNEEDTVVLQDGKKINVKPLNIKNLRRFMQVINKFEGISDNEKGLDAMVEAVQIALAKDYSDIADDKEYLEENLDMNSISKIMSVAGGVDINADPNLQRTG